MIELNSLIIPKFEDTMESIIYHDYTHYWGAGGRGSTKSSFYFIMLVVLIIQNPNIHAVVLRKVANTLKDSVLNQTVWAIELLGLSHLFKVTVSPMAIKYKPTGQMIYFRGADKPINIKSIKPPFGYIGVTILEELDQFNGMEEIRSILQSTNRGGDKFWNFYIFNPPKSRDNWVNIEIDEEDSDKLVTKNTYLDVPKDWLGEQFFYEAEKLKLKRELSYQHEYLGIATGTGGAVFENIEAREITDEEIKTLDYYFYGIDFGFAVDPFAWVELAYNRKKNTLYILQEIYEVKLSNKTAVERIKAKMGEKRAYQTADSAEPKSIADFRGQGLLVNASKEGADSVNRGFKWLQDIDTIIIDKKRTPNAYKEFTLYEYDINKNGEYISNYPDKNNHILDATRYALESQMKPQYNRIINV